MISADEALVARVLAGDREAYGELVRRHQDPMYRYALGMIGSPDAASDLVQDALVKGLTRLATCQDPARFAAWVFRILRNLCLDYLKDRRRDVVPLDPEMPYAAGGEDPQLGLEREELRRSVTHALGALPDAQREAFLMKHVEDLSYEEMSDRTGTSISALKMRVMRAREALHAVLGEPERAGM